MTDGRSGPAEAEIEITPEMIEAGEEEFTGYDSRVDDRKDVVRRIFEVMYSLLRRPKAKRALTCE